MTELPSSVHEKAVLVGVGERYTDTADGRDPFQELRMLADTAGAEVVGTIVQSRVPNDPGFFIGKGKVEELAAEVERTEAATVIFDNDLSPAQASNLEDRLKVKVIDRSGLILDIFALRAMTREAKVQVELAQQKYLLPRLTRRWTHLSRQAGGIGSRGPGETQLEIDRRRVRYRIGQLEKVLDTIEKQRSVARKQRVGSFRAALVGYTNAGKSTLLNALSGADVPVEDKLFKTLDSVTRVVRFPDAPDILVSDTVGFIRDLPHDLVASFQSTLSEVREADVLVHVVDATNRDRDAQIDTVNAVLRDLGVADTPMLLAFNKVDRLSGTICVREGSPGMPAFLTISAQTGEGLDALLAAMKKIAISNRRTFVMEFGPDRWEILREIYRTAVIHRTEEAGDAVRLTFTLPAADADRLGLTESVAE